MTAPDLNEQQTYAMARILGGANVFIAGSAGVGKSHLLNHIIKYLHNENTPIGVSATTGIAAIQLQGGRTVHGLLGLGLATKSASDIFVKNRRKYPKLIKRIRNMQILIIDEISMFPAELMHKINEYLQLVRGKVGIVFGGIQLILCGDFCQLAPVNGIYCFKSIEWTAASLETIELTEIMRQRGDAEFIDILETVRWGTTTDGIIERLLECQTHIFPDGIEPTVLYSRNADVDSINIQKIMVLVEHGVESKTYFTQYSISPIVRPWADSLRVEESVLLAIGAQVMLTVNLDVEAGLVNGSRGIITALLDDTVTVKFMNGETTSITIYTLRDEQDDELWVTYIPLRVAYAISIHKSQGLTLDAVQIDLGPSIFAEGQAYTALSRAKSLESIKLVALRAKSFKCNPDVLKFYGKVLGV